MSQAGLAWAYFTGLLPTEVKLIKINIKIKNKDSFFTALNCSYPLLLEKNNIQNIQLAVLIFKMSLFTVHIFSSVS